MITSSCKNRFGRVPIGINRTETKTCHIFYPNSTRPVVSTKCTRNICFEPLRPFWQIVSLFADVLTWNLFVLWSHLAVCSASVAATVLTKPLFSSTSIFKKLLQYLSHRMFAARVWSIKCRRKEKLIAQFGGKLRDKHFEPN